MGRPHKHATVKLVSKMKPEARQLSVKLLAAIEYKIEEILSPAGIPLKDITPQIQANAAEIIRKKMRC